VNINCNECGSLVSGEYSAHLCPDCWARIRSGQSQCIAVRARPRVPRGQAMSDCRPDGGFHGPQDDRPDAHPSIGSLLVSRQAYRVNRLCELESEIWIDEHGRYSLALSIATCNPMLPNCIRLSVETVNLILQGLPALVEFQRTHGQFKTEAKPSTTAS
jgi:hypothetical protein